MKICPEKGIKFSISRIKNRNKISDESKNQKPISKPLPLSHFGLFSISFVIIRSISCSDLIALDLTAAIRLVVIRLIWSGPTPISVSLASDFRISLSGMCFLRVMLAGSPLCTPSMRLIMLVWYRSCSSLIFFLPSNSRLAFSMVLPRLSLSTITTWACICGAAFGSSTCRCMLSINTPGIRFKYSWVATKNSLIKGSFLPDFRFALSKYSGDNDIINSTTLTLSFRGWWIS